MPDSKRPSWTKVVTITCLAFLFTGVLNHWLFLSKVFMVVNGQVDGRGFFNLFVFLLPFFLLGGCFLARPTGNPRLLVIAAFLAFLGLCYILNVLGVAGYSRIDNLSTTRSGADIQYQNICLRETQEWQEFYQCEFQGISWLPFVQVTQEIILDEKYIDTDAQNKTPTMFKNVQFQVAPRLLVIQTDVTSWESGYVLFRSTEDKSAFEILMITDRKCAKSETTLLRVPNAGTFFATLCGKKYEFRLSYQEDKILAENVK